MKRINEANFRAIYHRFLYIEDKQTQNKLIECIEDAKIKEQLNYDGLLCFGYIDYTRGLTLEVLSGAKVTEKGLSVGDKIGKTRLFIRVGGFSDDCLYDDYSCDELLDMHADYLKRLLSIHEKNETVIATRDVEELDPFRNREYPDDVQVYIASKGMQIELVWVRIYGLNDNEITGILLNEPNQNFGIHENDIIGFYPFKIADKKILLSSLKTYGKYRGEF